ncbi:hypothetical protein [Enterobacter hormaechei]|uniref:hypothetical protein n=1 Tax=Enterobacter hormaechei TaxID=158836 RepID=UPI003890ECCC
MNNTQSDNNLFYFNRLTYITPHEVALAMNGFDYDTENDELTDIQLKEVIRLRKAITRNLQLINEYKNISATQKVEANLVLTAAYIFQREDIVPVEIKERIENALQQQVKNKDWGDILMMLGGSELYEVGKKLRSNGRGQYRKDDEDNYSCKLIYLLIELLKKHGKGNYSDNSVIYNDIVSFCNENEILLKGIKKATFYKKIKLGKDIIKYGE